MHNIINHSYWNFLNQLSYLGGRLMPNFPISPGRAAVDILVGSESDGPRRTRATARLVHLTCCWNGMIYTYICICMLCILYIYKCIYIYLYIYTHDYI